jgi:hypothetical protein
VHANRRADHIDITASGEELVRVAGALREIVNQLSRAEFYIRLGSTQSNIEELAEQLYRISIGAVDEFDVEIPAGVESEENPPAPRGKGGSSTG